MPRSSTGVPHPGAASGKNAGLVLIRGYDPTDIPKSGGGDDPTAGTTPTNTPLNYFTDIIPFRDYLTMYLAGNTTVNIDAPPWETDVSFAPFADYGAYSAPNAPTATFKDARTSQVLPAFNDPLNPPRYVAAWHDDMPAMIRIIMKVDDPNNKVKDGPWYEYVFRLK
jgi:hypothetical protein